MIIKINKVRNLNHVKIVLLLEKNKKRQLSKSFIYTIYYKIIKERDYQKELMVAPKIIEFQV